MFGNILTSNEVNTKSERVRWSISASVKFNYTVSPYGRNNSRDEFGIRINMWECLITSRLWGHCIVFGSILDILNQSLSNRIVAEMCMLVYIIYTFPPSLALSALFSRSVLQLCSATPINWYHEFRSRLSLIPKCEFNYSPCRRPYNRFECTQMSIYQLFIAINLRFRQNMLVVMKMAYLVASAIRIMATS